MMEEFKALSGGNPEEVRAVSTRLGASAAEKMLKLFIEEPRDEPAIIRMLITPDIAHAMEAYNTNNRKLSDSIVVKYAREMSEGRWKFNTDIIAFSKSGRLLNGQHRIRAVLMADTPILADVGFGYDDDAFDVIDIGKVRNMGDILHIAGFGAATKYETDLAASVRLLLDYRNLLEGKPVERESSPQVIQNVLMENIGLIDAINFVRGKKVVRLATPSIAALVFYFAAKTDKDKAEQFIADISDPRGDVSAENPAMKFREAMMKNKYAKSKLSRYETLIMMIRAWNAYLEGRELKSLYGRQTPSGLTVPIFSQGCYRNEIRRKDTPVKARRGYTRK